MQSWWRFWLLFVALAVVVRADFAQDLARVHVEAIGGAAKVEALTRLRAEGRVLIDGRKLGFTLWAERPNRVRIETKAEGLHLIQGYDGTGKPWKQAGPEALVQPMAEAEAAEFLPDAEFDDPLVNASERGYALDYAGRTSAADGSLLKILVTRRLSDSYLLYLDPVTYYLVRKERERVLPGGRRVVVVTRFDDYRPVAGVMFARRIVVMANERVLHETILSDVDGNPRLRDGWFSAPERKD